MQDIWQDCHGTEQIQPLQIAAWRVTEAQHESSTRKLVSNLDEHECLENMIDRVKPKLPPDSTFIGLHYLLAAPFRYPPLTHGSRFGYYLEPSLWYGSIEYRTVFSEVAFYRFLFNSGSDAELIPSEIKLTAYRAAINTPYGINLTQTPFLKYKHQLSSPMSYQYSQRLGTQMRDAGVAAFLYYGARITIGTNIGVFTPKAFACKTPIPGSQETWTCFADDHTIEFIRSKITGAIQFIYAKDDFTIDGILPFDKMAASGVPLDLPLAHIDSI